ncbi:unnamed protein product [Cylindrotheca closterium]|uniref:Ankyrin repeat domain-containing protein n=1 Tax=Cylindrotheca closterium TaxID=2856 RepID=A0AAD2JMJ3_9STRA|nr:unnamed protein product [Cylindrotheca closterium]
MTGVSSLLLSDEESQLFGLVSTNDGDALKGFIDENTPAVNINAIGKGGQTPLMFAVLSGKDNAVKVLLEAGADTTIGEQDGYTPMHGAGYQGRTAIVKLLVDHGLDPLDTHKDGFIGMHRACWGPDTRHTETVRAFLEAGVPPDYPSEIDHGGGKTCMAMTPNPHTKEILGKAMAAKDEL